MIGIKSILVQRFDTCSSQYDNHIRPYNRIKCVYNVQLSLVVSPNINIVIGEYILNYG